jgi:hypothetical protein
METNIDSILTEAELAAVLEEAVTAASESSETVMQLFSEINEAFKTYSDNFCLYFDTLKAAAQHLSDDKVEELRAQFKDRLPNTLGFSQVSVPPGTPFWNHLVQTMYDPDFVATLDEMDYADFYLILLARNQQNDAEYDNKN